MHLRALIVGRQKFLERDRHASQFYKCYTATVTEVSVRVTGR